MNPRCSRHKELSESPKLCHICQRIDVEIDIVTRTVDALLTAGYALATDQGSWTIQDTEPKEPTTDRAVILGCLMEVCDEHLFACKDGKVRWVYFVYGNYGFDVISDYTVSLEPILEPVNDYAETLDAR